MSLVGPWATPEDLASTPCAAVEAPEDLLPALRFASAVLYGLTGGRWPGVGEDTVRPCSPLLGGRGWCGCESPRVCGCRTASAVELPGTPAVSVEEVVLDGDVVDGAAYRLMGQLLLRTDGGRWPCCQDWAVDGDQPGAFSVRYRFGAAPPEEAVTAAALLACELHRAFSGDGACRLPKRVTTVTRQGVSFALLDPMTVFSEGGTGLPEVDLWLGSLRAFERRPRATVLRPGRRSRYLRDTPPVAAPPAP